MSQRISLTVETPTGAYSVAFGPNHHFGAVIGEVLARHGGFGLSGDYQLVTEEGHVLPTEYVIGSSRVEDGDTLYLESNPSGGI